ncbi:MAG: Pycsar system effector family protein [Candidatus Neomarinimicrobiota bacterium]
MVFFIVYYRLLAINPFIVVVPVIYFGAAFLAIFSLMRTIQPRIHPSSPSGNDESNPADPTFVGGIRQYSTSEEYHAYLSEIGDDEEHILRLLSRQIHSLAQVNWAKNDHLRKGVRYFVVAVGTELLMILSTFIAKGLETLSV